MTAVWLNPGIGEAIVRGEKQLDSKSLKVYEVAVPNRRKWTSHFCIGLRRLLVRVHALIPVICITHGSFVLPLPDYQRHGLRLDHFHDLHHAEVFMIKDMAVDHELAYKVQVLCV